MENPSVTFILTLFDSLRLTALPEDNKVLNIETHESSEQVLPS